MIIKLGHDSQVGGRTASIPIVVVRGWQKRGGASGGVDVKSSHSGEIYDNFRIMVNDK